MGQTLRIPLSRTFSSHSSDHSASGEQLSILMNTKFKSASTHHDLRGERDLGGRSFPTPAQNRQQLLVFSSSTQQQPGLHTPWWWRRPDDNLWLVLMYYSAASKYLRQVHQKEPIFSSSETLTATCATKYPMEWPSSTGTTFTVDSVQFAEKIRLLDKFLSKFNLFLPRKPKSWFLVVTLNHNIKSESLACIKGVVGDWVCPSQVPRAVSSELMARWRWWLCQRYIVAMHV